MAALDPTFNPDVNGTIYAITPQPDGKILIGGGFTAVNGSTRNRIARLNSDGTLDTAFNPDLDGQVFDVTLQPDGKILTGGSFSSVNGSTRNRVARLNADGTLDTGFSPDVNGTVHAVTPQPDGKILIGGYFSLVNGSTRINSARLNADGTHDLGYPANVDGEVRAITLQPDGKILIAGLFSTVNGQPRSRRARLNADGTLDATFIAAPITSYNRQHAIVVDTDGNILTAGVDGFAAARRFTPSGTPNGYVNTSSSFTAYALALQADGKIWLGGASTYADARLRRANANLSNDVSITPTLNGTVEALALQPDGKLLVGGAFTAVNGVTRNYIARLLDDVVPNDEIHANNDSATTLTNTPVTVNILANDTKNGVPPVALADLQGLPTITLPPSNGTATVNPDGTVTYTPNPGFVGTDYFDYTILGQPGAPGINDVDLYMGPGQITIHNLPIGVVVNWGDGSPTHTVQASDPYTVSHTYAAGGNYVCRISGTGDIRQSSQQLIFTGAALLGIPDWGVISFWGPAGAVLKSFSFSQSPNLVQVPPTLPWPESTLLANVFWNCYAFNGDLSGWDTSNIVLFTDCFRDATSFNQPLPWDVGNAAYMQGMFNGATSFNQDLSAWCVEDIATEPMDFATNTPAWTLPKPNWGVPC